MNFKPKSYPPAAQAACKAKPKHPSISIACLDADACLRRLRARNQAYQKNYYAMYSSLVDAVTTDPRLMTIPFDDHMVHRGDGVFEVLACRNLALYNLDAHLDRLMVSVETLKLKMPVAREQLPRYIAATVRAGKRNDCAVRINISRGPGGFSVDPAESVAPQIYLVAYQPAQPFMKRKPEGATAALFSKPLHHFTRPVIKSCNYLYNVLMKLEAVGREVDFMIARDRNGYLAEGATESLACVTKRGDLVFPRPNHILRGTTAARAKVLARQLVRDGLLRSIKHSNISPSAARSASEIILFGTSIVATGIKELDGKPVGDGKPGAVAKALARAIEQDMLFNPDMRTAL